jgi:hypothetical protein
MMALASRTTALRQTNTREFGGTRASLSRLVPRFAIAPIVLSLLAASAAHGDIYKWTDDQGGTVYSNSPPENPKKAANVERVVKERVVPPTEQSLLDRIDNLERRLRTQAYVPPAPPAPPAPAVAPPGYNDGGYYYPPPAPDYTGYATPAFHPVYRYPLTPAYSYVVYPTRGFVTRPAFHGGARGFARSGFAHHGRR